MTLVARASHKSLEEGCLPPVDLPMFAVLTGPNGSGKSHLLEAIKAGAVVFAESPDLDVAQVRLFEWGQLQVTNQPPGQPQAFREPWQNLYSAWQQYKAHGIGLHNALDGIDHGSWLTEQLVQSRQISRDALDVMLQAAGKSVLDLDIEDFRDHAPLVVGVRDAFTNSIAEVFLTYSERRTRNEIAQWRLATKRQGSALSDSEFEKKYGPPPWDLLDETLAIVGLAYHFVPPVADTDTAYIVQLRDDQDRAISLDKLSSGERTLLAIALSLFSGSRMRGVVELPKVLLLDEADSSLHPSMVKSLITVIEEVFVKQYGVRVLMTTHSPTTVALAPEDSIFVMSKAAPRLRKTTPDAALTELLAGLPSLSVRVENRRQVFVESEYDQAVFQEMYKIVRAGLSSERSLEFIAAGRRESGGGCDLVKRLVADLRAGGSSTVFGLIDRDHRSGAPDHIHYVRDRYAIESVALDPLLLGVFLLRSGIVDAAGLGLASDVRHYEVRNEHAEAIVAAVSARLGFVGASIECVYLGGARVDVPSEFLEMRGHDLQEAVRQAYPPLKALRQDLLRHVVKFAARDLPSFIPASVVDLFGELLAD